MLKVSGLDKLSKQLNEASKALGDLDGTLGKVSFEVEDPSSIDRAIKAMEQMIDSRVGHLAGNPIIGPLAEQMKETYRRAILEKASAARLGASESNA